MLKEKPKTFVCRWCHQQFLRPDCGNIALIDGRAHCVPAGNESSPTPAETAEPIEPEVFAIDSVFPQVRDAA